MRSDTGKVLYTNVDIRYQRVATEEPNFDTLSYNSMSNKQHLLCSLFSGTVKASTSRVATRPMTPQRRMGQKILHQRDHIFWAWWSWSGPWRAPLTGVETGFLVGAWVLPDVDLVGLLVELGPSPCWEPALAPSWASWAVGLLTSSSTFSISIRACLTKFEGTPRVLLLCRSCCVRALSNAMNLLPT
jgi:hypothetical protein